MPEEVHPHMRGDNGGYLSVTGKIKVHPHMRGDNICASLLASSWARFTPTCVGTTSPYERRLYYQKVHPHMRGDNGRAAA